MSTDTRLVGLMGRAQAGKDTAATALLRHGWARVAFADPLRQLAYNTDPIIETRRTGGTTYARLSWIVDRLGWDEAKQVPDVRRYLQRLGAEGVRDVIGDTTWIDLAMQAQAKHPRCVVTDVRFRNEVEAIRDAGGIVVEVVRPDVAPVPSLHPSETEQASVVPDAMVLNDHDVAGLHRQILDLVGLGLPQTP